MVARSRAWLRFPPRCARFILVSLACGVLSAAAGAVCAAAESLPAPTAARPIQCRDAMVYYYPDTVGKDVSKIVEYYQKYLDAEVRPALGRRIRVHYFTKLSDLEQFIDQCQVSGTFPLFGALHAEVALQYRLRWKLSMYAYAILKDGSPNHNLVVLVRRESGHDRLGSLKGSTVLAPAYWGRNIARFDRQVLDGQIALSDFGKLIETPSSISAVMGVVFRQADAAIASNRVFEELRTRSPAFWHAIKTVHTSRPFPLAVLVFFPSTSGRDRRILARDAPKSYDTETGRIHADYEQGRGARLGTWMDLFTAAELTTTALPR
ncbi:MAG: PhnD/SsuA/transferrin family substrate-binding protein [Candidatus Schekmanbacteria bacterium]|nr:PhnD/SsuA/transferrin family substrate-binding protein [Candidatus Schekmanbacteria bacterium]